MSYYVSMSSLNLQLILLLFFVYFGIFSSFVPNPSRFLSTQPYLKQTYNLPIPRKSTLLNGIPKLFRWLVDLYPIVLESVNEGFNSEMSKTDNFYLDMNGIIHTCTHSNNDKLIVLNEKEMFQRIFAYTDRLYKLVRPKRLMFLAVDGVAPRAKMNQQRSRRFRSAKEQEVLLAEYVAREGKLPSEKSFDSNCITPGTDFMFRLGIAFRRWIAYKMETDPIWMSGAEVVFSGPDVPGEGEHKVMDMIRKEQEEDEKFKQGEMRNCMYGLDADLVMLSLVSHEKHFVLLREKMLSRRQNKDAMLFSSEDFELLEISILRKMLQQHFSKLKSRIEKIQQRKATLPQQTELVTDKVRDAVVEENSEISEKNESPKHGQIHGNEQQEGGGGGGWSDVGFELERIIDDFVFMCFFVGNDFLPCLPHMDIADGSLNLMMNVYRDMLPDLGGYITSKSSIHLPRLEMFIQEISRREPLYFQQRAIDDRDKNYAGDGYREHYYKLKLNIDVNDKEAMRSLVKSYIEGLMWVLSYYHCGCTSWTWYFPYLYAPLGTDLVNLAELDIEFEVGVPFTPLLQLLSVLPPQSGSFLPKSYENIMTSPTSPLTPYYPKDFEVDSNGKKNAWECVVKIPFINSTMLTDEASYIDHKKELNEMERLINILGTEHRFMPPGGKRKAESVAAAAAAAVVVGTERSNYIQSHDEETSETQSRWGSALAEYVRSPKPNPSSNSNSNYRNNNRSYNSKSGGKR